jgi:DDE superfamily endonuclease
LFLEMSTGIQAIERKSPDPMMRPGKRERREFEYIRHGTQTLIASFDVAQGRIVEATVGDTRTPLDYLSHIENPGGTHLIEDCSPVVSIF